VGQSLFTSQTPAVPNADNGNAIHLGTYIIPAVDGWFTHVRWYFPTTSQATAVKAAIYRTSDSTKISDATDVEFAAPGTTGAWNEVELATPVPVVGGTQYAAVIRTPQFYSATTGGASPWPLTNGDLAATAVNPGRFNDDNATDVQMVATAFNNGCYFVDVVFETELPDEEAEELAGSLTAPAATMSGSLAPSAELAGSMSGPAATMSGSMDSSASLAGSMSGPAATMSGSMDSSATLAGGMVAPAADLSGSLSMAILDTSSPNSAIRTTARPVVIATISRETVIMTGTRPGGGQ
jgi:hypothetical protein